MSSQLMLVLQFCSNTVLGCEGELSRANSSKYSRTFLCQENQRVVQLEMLRRVVLEKNVSPKAVLALTAQGRTKNPPSLNQVAVGKTFRVWAEWHSCVLSPVESPYSSWKRQLVNGQASNLGLVLPFQSCWQRSCLTFNIKRRLEARSQWCSLCGTTHLCLKPTPAQTTLRDVQCAGLDMTQGRRSLLVPTAQP